MKIYTRQFDAALGQMVKVETEMEVTIRSAVASIADLPASGNRTGDFRMALDTDHAFVYLNSTWVDQGLFDVMDLMQERLMQGLS